MLPSSDRQHNAMNIFWNIKVNDQGQGHVKGQKHIYGYNFGSNCRRDFKLSLLDSITQGLSYVTLTVTFDLDLEECGQGQYFQKKSDFRKLYRVVYQIKGLGPLISEI